MSSSSATPNASSFLDLGVPSDLFKVLSSQGIEAPFEIQAATIPDALAGRDVLGRAPTGSGKTLAFGIPMVAGLHKAKPKRPTGLILSPTRELAEQIRRELAPLAKVRDRKVMAIYGGVGFRDQLQGLRQGVDLVVACPGRLIDLLDQGALSLDAVRSVVVDEADRMADMGFLPAVRQLLDLTSTQRQTVLFSATLGREVKVLTDAYQRDAVLHEVGEVEPDLSLVTHRFIKTEKLIKVHLTAQLVDELGPTVVFCRTRHGVDRVARQLKRAGVKAGWIHGGRSQNQRDAALQAFTSGRVAALIATDVAARGIHVDGVAGVIHFDPPEDDKAYVHRSGRTARAGAAGTVVSFVNSDQSGDTKKLQRALGLSVPLEETPLLAERPVVVEHRKSSSPKKSTSKGGSSRGGGARSGSPKQRSSTKDHRSDNVAPRRQRRPDVDAASPATEGAGTATTSSGERSDNDWFPPSKNQGKRSAGKARSAGGRKGDGQKGKRNDDRQESTSKRSGRPRPKNKRGGNRSAHRKGGGDGAGPKS